VTDLAYNERGRTSTERGGWVRSWKTGQVGRPIANVQRPCHTKRDGFVRVSKSSLYGTPTAQNATVRAFVDTDDFEPDNENGTPKRKHRRAHTPARANYSPGNGCSPDDGEVYYARPRPLTKCDFVRTKQRRFDSEILQVVEVITTVITYGNKERTFIKHISQVVRCRGFVVFRGKSFTTGLSNIINADALALIKRPERIAEIGRCD
jgi:hypothetical protein